MKKLLLGTILLGIFALYSFGQQPSVLYFDFESDKNPEFTNVGGSWEGVVNNPAKDAVNGSDSVGSTLTGAAAWDGIQIVLDGYLDLRNENKFTMKVYHPTLQGETRLHFKGKKELKVDVMYTTPGEWAELTFEIPVADDNQYNQVLLCFAHERSAADELWYFDDLRGAPVYIPPQPNVYYSTVNFRKEWSTFDNTTYEVTPNPSPDMENSRPFAAASLTGINTWSGIYYDLAGPIDFTETQKFTILVYSDSIGDVRVQLEGDGVEKLKITVPYTTPGEWTMLTFDPANATSGNTSIVYTRFVLIFDDKDSDVGESWYFDEIRGPVLTIGDIDPVRTYFDFDETNTESNFFAWQSAVWGNVIENPAKAGVNTSDSVGLFYTGTDTWSGIAYDLPSTIDFSEGTIFTMMVYSDSAGIARFQLEQRGNSNTADRVRVLVDYTTPGEWAVLTFDAKLSEAAGPKDDYFNRVVLIFDAGDTDLGEEWYFDELMGPGLTPVYYTDVTFQVANVNTTSSSYSISLDNGDPMDLYNDGTNGDVTAGDSIWTVTVSDLPVGDYVMDVLTDGVLISSADDIAITVDPVAAGVTIEYVHDMTGIGEFRSDGFMVYPNPALDHITIRMNTGTIRSVSVYNIQGSAVKKINSIRQSEMTLGISDLASGLYFIRITDDQGTDKVMKFIKK